MTSFSELARDGMQTERANRLNPLSPRAESWVAQMLAGTHAQGGGQAGSSLRAVHHGAVDEPHHVKGRTIHRLVGTQAQRGRNRHIGTTDRSDDSELARHVVGCGKHMAQGRAAKNELCTVGPRHFEAN